MLVSRSLPRTSSFIAVLVALLGSGLASCRRDEAPPQPVYPPPGYAQQGPPQMPPGPTPPPPPVSTQPVPQASLPRGPSFPCASDGDFVCPFARCVSGGCGGCTSDADCKSNGACSPTPLGYACLARGFAPAPTAAPTPPATPPPTPWIPPQAPQAPTQPQVPSSVPPSMTADRFAQARQLCVTRTNEYRARVGAKPVVRRPDREACVDGEAAADAQSGKAHGTMGRCGESAQNACPDYPGQSPESTLSDCLAQMFAEGPGEPYSAHGHYINMTEPSYTGVACGIVVTASGKLWINQDFFR